MKRNDIQPIIEILPEGARFNSFRQILIRGGNDTDIDTDIVGAADSAEGLFLDNPEEA